MYEPDFWASSAEAMELSIEGNRLIAREIAGLVRNLWQRSVRRLTFLSLRAKRTVLQSD